MGREHKPIELMPAQATFFIFSDLQLKTKHQKADKKKIIISVSALNLWKSNHLFSSEPNLLLSNNIMPIKVKNIASPSAALILSPPSFCPIILPLAFDAIRLYDSGAL